MPWFWGKSEDDSEYESDEYTDGEYSDEEYEEYTDDEEEGEVEEAAVEEDKEEKDKVTKAEEEANDDHEEKKEMDKEPAVVTETKETNDKEIISKEDEEESYVEVTKEDAASPKAANDQAEEAKEDSKNIRSDSLLDAASVDEVEETSSIVEEEAAAADKKEDNEEPKDSTTPVETKVVVENPPPADEVVQVETVSSDEGSEFSDTTDEEEEDEELTSFADKQSMLLLAAEHDRVDILKAILTDEEDANIDKNALMNTGIPPLHVAISFGSTNTTSSLLRMGADPSIRPNLDDVQKHYASHQSKVEIKNMGRFDGISAWELAFGNAAYAKLEASGGAKRSSWVFGSAIQPVDDENGERVIGPLDSIPEAKRAGIQHAFTAEALRCLGGDELDRLKQLVDSGMPATTEIAEKDLYQWAVEMGAMQCEEYLRPVEAAKHANESDGKEGQEGADNAEAKPAEASEEDVQAFSISNARVLDRSRPGEDESPAQLRNKLVELDSLATALSTCVDNLAEEVSVCHGLLLMNGGASALASHVKSLKQQKADKEDELNSAYIELETLQERLAAVVQAAGPVGKQVMGLSEAELKLQEEETKKSTESSNDDESEDSEMERFELLDKIAASENKIRKLRISIADLSEESARDLQEVERRGLSGGIDLVRGLRDEIRDVEFQLAEIKSLMATCQTKIRLIRAKVSPETELPTTPPAAKPVPQPFDDVMEPVEETEKGNGAPKTTSQKIAEGDSQAIAVRGPGKQGFFRIDLWQVILRIIGMNRAADRRAIEVMQRQRKEQMDKIAAGGFEKRPEPIHVMTV